MEQPVKLRLLDEKFVISKLPQFAELPSVIAKGEMCFMMRTDEYLTIISPEFMAPNNVQQEIGYKCICTQGELALNSVGITNSIAQALSSQKISAIFVSTFSNICIFILEEQLVSATKALQQSGYEFVHED